MSKVLKFLPYAFVTWPFRVHKPIEVGKQLPWIKPKSVIVLYANGREVEHLPLGIEHHRERESRDNDIIGRIR